MTDLSLSHQFKTNQDDFYMYPLQAISRYSKPLSASNPSLANKIINRTSINLLGVQDKGIEHDSSTSIKKNDRNNNFPNPNPNTNFDIDKNTTNSNNDSGNKNSIEIDHNITNSDTSDSKSSEIPVCVLSQPLKHPSRSTTLFVPSQIHSGEDSMQHIVFTDSKNPFSKIR
jgi:hypothetical protein